MMKSKNETMWTEDGSVCMCTTRREATEKVRKWTIGGSMFMAAELKKAPGACFSRMPSQIWNWELVKDGSCEVHSAAILCLGR